MTFKSLDRCPISPTRASPPPLCPKDMASTTVLPVVLPVTASHKHSHAKSSSFRPLLARSGLPTLPKLASPPSSGKPLGQELSVSGLTALALTAAMVVPDIAEAAQPGISPSLKNYLLSIVAGGVVLAVLVGAVIAVANFDPVKRS
ncbi:uncharacterized protein LOC131233699 [Magnolia sinica]|uniref:uncharacterized protein LOC131233699 n=1 Tax=Magnolia sinica TaxID=86752 RepID=UPI00265B3FEC|nr:uncharacterized protein LOC131233699 [Magnolia sinica]